MPIQFPPSPTVNQEYTYEGKVWAWDGSSWVGVRQQTGILSSNIWAKQSLLIPKRGFGLNSGYNATTDQRRTKAGTIPMLKHNMERDLNQFLFGEIVTSGLVLNLDAGNVVSYPGTGTLWTDLSGNGNNFTIDASGFVYNSSGYFSMSTGGISKSAAITTASTCTCVFWMKTTDAVALFWSKTTGGSGYLGAYEAGAKFYNSGVGSPSFSMDTISKANIYDNIRDNQWHMLEFKSVDFSTWSSFNFSKYAAGYNFGDGQIASLLIYNRNLTTEESLQNYNATKGRFGL